jgi:hypothetical protein
MPSLRKLSPFWSLDLLDITRPAKIQSGRRSFTVPREVAPSAGRDGIYWAILLDADMAMPAELQQEFPFQVTP